MCKAGRNIVLQMSHLCVMKINISMKICVWANESKVRQLKKYIKAESALDKSK